MVIVITVTFAMPPTHDNENTLVSGSRKGDFEMSEIVFVATS